MRVPPRLWEQGRSAIPRACYRAIDLGNS
jgi:hypothetical protein